MKKFSILGIISLVLLVGITVNQNVKINSALNAHSVEQVAEFQPPLSSSVVLG